MVRISGEVTKSSLLGSAMDPPAVEVQHLWARPQGAELAVLPKKGPGLQRRCIDHADVRRRNQGENTTKFTGHVETVPATHQALLENLPSIQ